MFRIVSVAPGEGFEPSRPQRTTGFLSQIPGLGSLTWDLPRTRLGNPGVQLSSVPLGTCVSCHKRSHGSEPRSELAIFQARHILG